MIEFILIFFVFLIMIFGCTVLLLWASNPDPCKAPGFDNDHYWYYNEDNTEIRCSKCNKRKVLKNNE